jgi:hypothetical protein
MSIGDTKSYGNKGNNFPWQLQMLKGLQGIIDTLTAGVCCPPLELKAFIESFTTAGVVPSPVYSFSIANVGAAAGIVNGVSLPAGVTINFDPGVNNTIISASFDATGTTFLITYIA